MDWVEILGYVASGAVFVTFWMKTIIPLRLLAIVGNALFLAFGYYADLGNIVILHGALLPLNLYRLWQAVQLRKSLHEMASSDFDPRALLPFMSPVDIKRGQHLFKKGEQAHDIYFLARGRVMIEEIGQHIEPGEMIGEIAMFTPDKTRTQSAVCETDCHFMRITEHKALQLYAENPEFGLYVTKMMVARLMANAEGGLDRGRTAAA